MKILEVTSFFSPVHGGSAEAPYHLSKELAGRGHEVVIYTSDFKLSHEYIDSLPQVKICAFRTWLSLAKFYITPVMVLKAKEEIKGFDVVHLHNHRTFQNIVMHYYAKKYGIAYILQAHGSLATFFQKKWLKKTFDVIWGHRILKDAARVIAVAKPEVEQYINMGMNKDKIEIVPNGIDLSEFDNLPKEGEFRRKYGLDDEQKIIFYLGRINKIKGLDLLTKVFTDLSKEITNAKLVFAGPDDGYLLTLRRLAKELNIMDIVLFAGPLYGREKLEAYIDADMFVLPSVYEIFGITVLEALACGTPVIVTDRCGIAGAIDNGQAGLVVPYDSEQLRLALLKMLGDDKMRLQFSEKGKLLVREKFSREKMAEQMEKVYQSIV